MQWLLLLVAFAGVLVVGALFVASVRKRPEVMADEREDLSPDSRSLFSGTRGLRDEIRRLALEAPPGSMTKIVAEEAVRESERVATQVRDSLLVRQKLVKLGYAASSARIEQDALRERAEQALSSSERDSLVGAALAKENEIQHYAELNQLVSSIDANIRKAEATLSELKARLAVGLGRDHTESVDADQLRESLSQLKGLTLSVDEARAMSAKTEHHNP
jgi:regulator of replication initiation timing